MRKLKSAQALKFPEVPGYMLDPGSRMEPCPQVGEWAWSMFLDAGSSFYNAAHEDIAEAVIGWVWTNVENRKDGRIIRGTCGLGDPKGGTPWARARIFEQLQRWFGLIPDFIITLDAVWLSTRQPAEICALVEHELYHARHKRDKWGDKSFDKDGRPVYDIRPHDLECFIGEVERYGAWRPEFSAIADAMARGPAFSAVDLRGICGVG